MGPVAVEMVLPPAPVIKGPKPYGLGFSVEVPEIKVLPEAFAKLPWPKSMRFPGSTVRWVRPLHGIVCTFDGEVVPFELAGVTSGNVTYGHRFLSKGPIEVRRFQALDGRIFAAGAGRVG